MLKKQDIVVIGVIYNTFPEAVRYIESLAKIREESFLLILVDNSERPAPDYFTRILEQHSFIEYIKTGSNLGYFHGAQSGLDHYLSRFQEYPCWIIVTNVDIVFEDPGIFTRLKQIRVSEKLGVIAPAIVSGRWGTDYNPDRLKRYSPARLKFYRLIYSHPIISNGYTMLSYCRKIMTRLGSVFHAKANSGLSGNRIYAPHGSCILFHKRYFEKGGTLLHVSFLFLEEIFVAETASMLDLEIIYVPELKVRDYEHASTGFMVSGKMNAYHRQSVSGILMKYYNESPSPYRQDRGEEQNMKKQ